MSISSLKSLNLSSSKSSIEALGLGGLLIPETLGLPKTRGIESEGIPPKLHF